MPFPVNFQSKLGANVGSVSAGASVGAGTTSPSVAAAYGPLATTPAKAVSILNPTDGHGLGFYLRLGVIAFALLVYRSLPD